MKEQLISLETAKLAKEKGFNLFSQGWYGTDDPSYGKPNKFIERTYALWSEIGEEDSQEGTEIYSAPTQTLLQKWLREFHMIDVQSIPLVSLDKTKVTYVYEILKLDEEELKSRRVLVMNLNFEEALEKGLNQALEFYL